MFLPFSASAQDNTTITLPTLDLTLQKAIEIAVAENPTIRVAEKDIALKQIANKEAWQSLLPTADLAMTLTHTIKIAAMRITGMGDVKMGTEGSTAGSGVLTVAVPIFAPAVYQNMKLTKQDIELAQEKARASRLDLVNQVKKAYFSALLSKDSRDVMQHSYNVAKENFDIVDKKFKVGSVSEYDKITAEVQMRNMNSSLVSSETALTLALLKLKVLMGINTDFAVNINDSLKAYEEQITLANAEVTIGELENNSSMRQLDMNRGILERTRKVLRTNFMPTVAFQATNQFVSYSNLDWNFFKYHYNYGSSIAFSISVPLFKASNWTKLQTNRTQLEQLVFTRQNTLRQLSMAAESYRKNMISSITKLESDREAVLQANKAVSISSKRYEVGHGTILELNQSETALVQAELTYNQGIYDYLSNKADLDYTMGLE